MTRYQNNIRRIKEADREEKMSGYDELIDEFGPLIITEEMLEELRRRQTQQSAYRKHKGKRRKRS